MLRCWMTSVVLKTKRGPEVSIGLGPGRATLDLCRTFSSLLSRECSGNVQYRPYTAKGPVEEKPGDLRAVTLYELEDLVRIAGQKNKHVILIARQCGICGRTRAQALRPLLTSPSLKVFSTLVMDAATARELLD